jgi:hypothetical protein
MTSGTGTRSTGEQTPAIFSGKLDLLIHVPFKIILQGQIRSVVLGCLLYRNRLHVAPKGKTTMNNERTKFVRQVAKVDLRVV